MWSIIDQNVILQHTGYTWHDAFPGTSLGYVITQTYTKSDSPTVLLDSILSRETSFFPTHDT
jgi:hypothetical protein